MNTFVLLPFAAMVGLASSDAQAGKIKFYDFAEQCLDADVIIIARSLRCNGDTVSIEVAEYLLGSGPQEFPAAFNRHPNPRFRPPGLIEGSRLMFLRHDEGGLKLFGSELQAIWPQIVRDGGRSPFAGLGEGVVAGLDRGVDFLAELCRQVRSCADSESQIVVTSVLLDMFHSSDLFVRLAALLTCEHLYGRDPERYIDVRRLGSAFALETVGHPDGWLRNTSLGFMGGAPRSAALRSLLGAMTAPEVARGSHDAAFEQFCSLTQERRWDEQFQRRARNPDRELRAKAVEDMGEWLNENFARIFADDYEMIVRALGSEDIAMRTAGRLWLSTATGSDFGFEESAPARERDGALARIREWRVRGARIESAPR